MARDKKAIKDLKKLGWQMLIIWGCKTRNPVTLKKILTNFLIER
jgi:G:T-mismatch repair DNA endonuclease (very short patch repair protein)